MKLQVIAAVMLAGMTCAPALGADWNGFYAGVVGGSQAGAMARTSSDLAMSGAEVGVLAGYRTENAGLVYGAEADAFWSGLLYEDAGVHANVGFVGSARAIVGMSFDRFMPFATAGVAVGSGTIRADWSAIGAGEAGGSATHLGLSIGAGFEVAVTDNITLRGEYRYSYLAPAAYDLEPLFTRDFGYHINSFRTGVLFKF